VGQIYVAKKTFIASPSSQFVMGKRYVFQDVGWSHYDSSTIFKFLEEGASNSIFWWWDDNQPESMCYENFEITGKIAPNIRLKADGFAAG
jgi:hypothetical protein